MRIQCIQFAGGDIADDYQISLIKPQSVVILVAGQKLALWSSPSGITNGRQVACILKGSQFQSSSIQ
jgi:hypothetical protein